MLVESKSQPETMGNNVGMFGLELGGTYDCKTVKGMAGSGDFRRNRIRSKTGVFNAKSGQKRGQEQRRVV